MKETIINIHNYLHYFTNPENSDGFINYFARWVLQKWSSNEYYLISHLKENNYFKLKDYPKYAIKTGELLRDCLLEYEQFIHAGTGCVYPRFPRSDGQRRAPKCEKYYDRLCFFYSKMIGFELIKYCRLHHIKLMMDYDDYDASDLDGGQKVHEVMIHLYMAFQAKEGDDRQLLGLVNRIDALFGRKAYASALAQHRYIPSPLYIYTGYTKNVGPAYPNHFGYTRTRFSKYSLDDFKSMITI